MRRYRWIVLTICFALAPMVAGASVSYTWDAGLDDWGPWVDAPWGSATDCVWVSDRGHDQLGAMRAGRSCLSPQFTKSASTSVEFSYWMASTWTGLAGIAAVVLDPFSGEYYMCGQMTSPSSDLSVWVEQEFTCDHVDVLAATSFHVLIDHGSSGTTYIDDFGTSGASMSIPPTATPAPVLATATPTVEPIIFPATPTPVPTWVPAATPTPIPQPTIPTSATPTPGAPGSLYFPLAGVALLGYASGFLGDWSAIIGPAAIAALSATVLVLLGKFLGGGR